MTHKTLFRLCQTENISFSCFYFHSLIFFPEKRGWWTEGVWCACKHQCSVCSWQTKVQCSVFILIAKSGKESKAKCKLYTLRADWEGLKGQLSAVLMQLSSCFSDHKSRTSARLRLGECASESERLLPCQSWATSQSYDHRQRRNIETWKALVQSKSKAVQTTANTYKAQ